VCKVPLKESEWKSSGSLALLDIVKESTEVYVGEGFEQEKQVQVFEDEFEEGALVF
jgi:hypothetical protein